MRAWCLCIARRRRMWHAARSSLCKRKYGCSRGSHADCGYSCAGSGGGDGGDSFGNRHGTYEIPKFSRSIANKFATAMTAIKKYTTQQQQSTTIATTTCSQNYTIYAIYYIGAQTPLLGQDSVVGGHITGNFRERSEEWESKRVIDAVLPPPTPTPPPPPPSSCREPNKRIVAKSKNFYFSLVGAVKVVVVICTLALNLLSSTSAAVAKLRIVPKA
ncbi:unnamed protein product [Ceratitis capitata]|uniref:(Mediterranean fruit fly) hypothetical protein n=1 Tax=Ceratitis capitata TaxID=7213 RepID=A0A811UW19_CERCA|nr:unnamed protein product [Ceratitis capitata]